MSGTRNYCTAFMLLVCCACPGLVSASEHLIEQGEYIFNVAGCGGCHGGDQPLEGGKPIATPFGTFYAPNITPHRENGIGAWTEADFSRALEHGRSPGGEHYFPVFPYASYTKMTASDKSALWAYINSRPASDAENRAHDLSWVVLSRKLMGLWKLGRFKPVTYSDDTTKSREWNRGAYIANALGHCGECHTPRGPLGGLRNSLYLAGSRKGPDGTKVPNITPDPRTGIGSWSHQELVIFLETGRRPDGSRTQGLMAEVLETSMKSLSESDRHSLASYLLSVPPIHHDVDSTFEFVDASDGY